MMLPPRIDSLEENGFAPDFQYATNIGDYRRVEAKCAWRVRLTRHIPRFDSCTGVAEDTPLMKSYEIFGLSLLHRTRHGRHGRYSLDGRQWRSRR